MLQQWSKDPQPPGLCDRIPGFPLALHSDFNAVIRLTGADQRDSCMSEIVFLVEEAAEGGYTARALGESIFTEADDLQSLRAAVKDAVLCHLGDGGTAPRLIRLHFVRDEVFAV